MNTTLPRQVNTFVGSVKIAGVWVTGDVSHDVKNGVAWMDLPGARVQVPIYQVVQKGQR